MQLKSATAIIGLTLSASVSHADTGWSLDAGFVNTDNVTLAHAGGPNETVASVGGAVEWELESTRLKASLNGAGGFLNYLNNTFDNDFRGQITGSAVYQLLPEHFSWTLDDHFGQVTNDPFAPATPANLQNANVVNTGPDIHLRLGDQTRLQLAARYSDTHYEDSGQIDVRSWGGSIGLLRELSQAASLGLFASQHRYSYDDPGVPLYDQRAAWASWQSKDVRQTLSVDLGVNRVLAVGEAESNPLVRIDWKRQLQPSWKMDLQLGSEYQNSGQQFADSSTGNAGNAGNVSIGITARPASVRYADLSFAFDRARTRFGIGGGWREADYVGTSEFDEDGWSVRGELSRRFTPRLEGYLRYRFDQRNYQTVSIKEGIGSAGLDWRLGSATFLTFGYSRTNSDGDQLQNQYSDNVFSIRLSWRGGAVPIGPRTFGY